MKGQKTLVLVVVVGLAVSVGVYAYYLTMPRSILTVYPDSKVTGCKERVDETVMLHVKNDGTVDLYVNACWIDSGIGGWSANASYMFQSDIVIPIGVEAVITFPASGGEVLVETVSGPQDVTGGVYAISDNPDPNPFVLGGQTQLWIYSRSGVLVGGEATSPISLVP